MTLCFVICRFDFGVLTFYFRILSFLLCVLCIVLSKIDENCCKQTLESLP